MHSDTDGALPSSSVSHSLKNYSAEELPEEWQRDARDDESEHEKYDAYHPRPKKGVEIPFGALSQTDPETGEEESYQDTHDRLLERHAPTDGYARPKLGYLAYLAVKYRACGYTTAETVKRIAADGYQVTDRHIRDSWARYVAWHCESGPHRARLVPARFEGHRCPERHDVDAYVNHFPPGPELAESYYPRPELRPQTPRALVRLYRRGTRFIALVVKPARVAPHTWERICGNCVAAEAVTEFKCRGWSGEWRMMPVCSECSKGFRRGDLDSETVPEIETHND